MPIGESLRRARTERGLELGAVSEAIKIRVRYLRALEAEDWDSLPAPAYARGFLRTYADYLGLDADALVEELRRALDSAAGHAPPEELRPPVVEPPSGFPSPRTLIAVAAVVAVLAVLFVIGQIGGGSGGGNGRGGGGGGPTAGHHARHHHRRPSKPQPPPEPTRASIEVRPTGTVWVCLEDLSGKPLVAGEVLSAGDTRGPYHAAGFQLGLGNSEAAITANGRPVKVPSSPNPLAFHVGPTSAKSIDPAKRPTCA
jgi:cytoskeleton protein RodZ